MHISPTTITLFSHDMAGTREENKYITCQLHILDKTLQSRRRSRSLNPAENAGSDNFRFLSLSEWQVNKPTYQSQ